MVRKCGGKRAEQKFCDVDRVVGSSNESRLILSMRVAAFIQLNRKFY